MPWQAGKSAVWDVTDADKLADSYLATTLTTAAAAAAELVVTRKEAKYVALSAKLTPLCLSSLRIIGSHWFQSHELCNRTR